MQQAMQQHQQAMQQQQMPAVDIVESGTPPVTVQATVVVAQEMTRDDGDDLPAQIAKLKALMDEGALDTYEFRAAKAKLLASA